MRSSFLDYSMSVIVSRALPDVRDGLKPVHRRILFAMHNLGLAKNRPFRKCAAIVGDTMRKYHPHGDSSIYDTLVRMGISNEALTALVEDCPSRFAFAANWFQRFRGDNLDDAYRQQEIERTLLWVNDWLHGRGVTPTAVPTTRPAQRRLALTRKEE